MQASDICDLAQNLKHKLEDAKRSLDPYLGGKHRFEELVHITSQITVAYNDLEKSSRVIEKEWEKRIKVGLYRLESLLIEIEAFQEVGSQHSKSDVESYVNSVACEVQLILEELKHCSDLGAHLVTEDIIFGKGYNKLKEKLVEWVSDSNSALVLPISGKPGIGKSTLTRFVFSACRSQNDFDIAEWVSLSKLWIRKDLVKVVIKSMMKQPDLPSGIDDLLNQLHECVSGKKYLLVLDDLLDKDFLRSLCLKDMKDPFYSAFAETAKKGSKILITTKLRFEHFSVTLPSFNEDESLDLFQSIAFRGLLQNQQELPIGIGLQICRKCDLIPAAIKIIGSILSTKPTLLKWMHFYDVIVTGECNLISSIPYTVELISSQLDTIRRHCFAFCSLLPKDYKFKKNDILNLWMAHGFQKSKYGAEKKLETYFNEFLMNGIFLTDDMRDHTSPTISYRISDLAHELMKHVAGDEFCLVDKPTIEVDHRIIRHVSFIVDSSWEAPSWLNEARQLQSLLLWPSKSGDFITIPNIDLSQVTNLCILHIEAIHFESLPKLLEKLKGLRYLRLGAVSCMSLLEYIPAARALPLLDSRCVGAAKLIFNGGVSSIDGTEPEFSLFTEPTSSENLTINYEICFESDLLRQTHQMIEALNDISLVTSSFPGDASMLELLKPHQFIESEALCWKGQMFPVKVINEFTVLLHHIICVEIVNCNQCQHLPPFSALPNLRSLQLWGLKSVEFIEICDVTKKPTSGTAYFPSLKSLMLGNMPHLKEWSRKTVDDHQYALHTTFPRLIEVKVQGCPNLISMPYAPVVESMEAININVKILEKLLSLQDSSLIEASSASIKVRKQSLDSASEKFSAKITHSVLQSLEFKQSLGSIDTPKQHVSFLKYLKIDGCKGFDWGDTMNAVQKSTFSLKAVWHRLLDLRSLRLINSSELVSLPIGIEFIASLEQLSLCSLKNVKVLPEGIGHLSRLRWLTIHYCPQLTMLPNSLGSFSALEQLAIRYCPRLKQFPKSFPKLKVLQVHQFNRLDKILHASQNLQELEIDSCELVDRDVNIATSEEENSYGSLGTWQGLKSLRSLQLSNISRMESLPRYVQFLQALEKLCLFRLFKLQILPDWVGQFMQLRWLSIQFCPELLLLPGTFGSLSSLEHLEIEHCTRLKQLPTTLKNIMSLKLLEIQKSPELETRCMKPNGEDWPLIQHIPNVICGEISRQEEPYPVSVS